MEIKRRSYRNKISNDIKSTQSLITRSYDTIKRLKSSSLGLEYITTQISKLNDLIQEKTEHLELLKNDLLQVDSGEKDYEINQTYEIEKARTDKIIKECVDKKMNTKKETEKKKEETKIQIEKSISENRNHKQAQKDINYAHKYFNKVCSQLPDYMIKNLSEMPNNKGYIWRGVHFYGDLEAEHGPTILFEKQKNILLIHEYYPAEYRRYEKNGNERKVLVHSEQILPKQTGINIMDYCKTSRSHTQQSSKRLL